MFCSLWYLSIYNIYVYLTIIHIYIYMTIYALGIFGHGIAVTGSQVLPFRVRSVDPWFPFQVDKL